MCIGSSWQWQDEDGCWQMYDHQTCVQLEKARTSGDTHVELSAAGRKYRIDVKRMEQINIKTKVARKVQRICNGKSFLFCFTHNITALLNTDAIHVSLFVIVEELHFCKFFMQHTHTHTTVLRLCGICPGKPG